MYIEYLTEIHLIILLIADKFFADKNVNIFENIDICIVICIIYYFNIFFF